MSNSKLVSYTNISPNRNAPRNAPISRITPHCVVGQCSVEALGNLFANPGRQASSNYGIGADARVGMYCPESDRAWTSSSPYNDNRAVTIECASDNYYPYAFNWVVYLKLVDLCVDICQRNGKNRVVWLGHDNYSPKSNEMLFTLHRWYASTSCPGDWLVQRMGDLASRVNAKLGEKRDYLMLGDSGEAVKTMQTMLIACGYSCGSYGADGQFGDATLNALKKFQKAAGLDVDGYYGPKSRAALTDKYLGKTKEPTKDVLYYVQAGAYRTKANAEKQVAALKAKGVTAIIKQIDGVYKVQAGAYKNKANAEKQVAALKAKGITAFVAN